ncbi:MAG: TIGR01906 family membrane protein [Dehalococcoidales bacterium]|nr:TIGR01906 family membrane protein [Dehalococcoidales bacterium]
MSLKNLGAVARWLFILSLPPLILSATIYCEFNSLRLYQDGFEKYHISQTTGLDETELNKAASGLISYFNSDEEYISLTVLKDGEPFELFNQREIAHLKDVKALVQLDFRLMLGTAIYVGVFTGLCLFWRKRRYRRELVRDTFIGSIITLGMIVGLGIASVAADFDQLFLQFHFLAFTNELWMLDPARDYLIMLFPEGFWFDTAMLMGGIIAGVAGTLCGVSAWQLRRARKQALLNQ